MGDATDGLPELKGCSLSDVYGELISWVQSNHLEADFYQWAAKQPSLTDGAAEMGLYLIGYYWQKTRTDHTAEQVPFK